MLLSLQRLPLFAFFLLKLLGLMANAFLPKGLFGSLNDSTGQIVLQPHGTNGRKSYHPILLYSKHSFYLINSTKSGSSPSLNGAFFLDYYMKTLHLLFLYNFFKIPCLTKFFLLEMINQILQILQNSVMFLLKTFPQ